MYCPKCFNQSLYIGSSGKGSLAINGKQSSSSVFLYNLNNQDKNEIHAELEKKIDELLSWYSGFKNVSPISTFEIYSGSFICQNECSLEPTTKISLVGPLIDESKFQKILHKLAGKYKLTLQL